MRCRPNILIIVADHLSQGAVGAYGSAERRTPHVDRLARRGARWQQAYTPCPLCMPARASLWTGRLPHETGVFTNQRDARVPPDMPTLGGVFREAGYHCVHYGKRHDADGLRDFHVVTGGTSPVEATPPWVNYHDTTEDRHTREQAVAFLERWGPEPYLLVADFNNPHDICLWIGDHAGPHTDEPVPGRLPPLPPNFDTDDLARRPLVIREAARRNPRVAQTQGWTEANFRYYLAAFYHYVEMLDREVGCVLNAWSRRPDAANTVVILTVDHGEAMAAHRMVTKSWHFYEEVVRVPLIFAGPGIAGEGRAIGGSLASLLDVFPTLCDLAAIAPPPGLRGRSLGPALAGSTEPAGPDCVVSTYGAAQLDSGAARMVRTARFKYTHFNEDGGEELFDLENDPGEQRSLVEHPDWAAELAVHRARLQRHCAATGDPYPMQAAPAFAQGPEDGGVPGGAARGPDRRVLRARGVKAC